MNSSIPLGFGPRQLQRVTWMIVALWTLAVAASLAWNARLLNHAMFKAATHGARNNFSKDLLYRRWATSHGGVYVPVTTNTPPNPYLTNVVERDLVTPSGRQLTLMNPAYMTRQVHELGRQFGLPGHITSLRPLRPANAPDAWEAAALRAFEQGRDEVRTLVTLDGQPHLRLMKPLVAEAGCLPCHAGQGYHEGDIRGGISVTVPMAPYLAFSQTQIERIACAHAALWGLGVLGILLGRRQMRQRLDKQLQAEEALRRSETKFHTLYDSTSDAVMLLNREGFFDCNPAALAMFGCANREEFCSKHPGEISPPLQPDGRDSLTVASQHIATALEKGSQFFEWMHRRADTGKTFPTDVLLTAMKLEGEQVVQAVVRDITARKQAEAERDRLIQELQSTLAHVKTLSGLIPICAGCKKIRDDKNFWHQVESYISEHTDARFTHGLCPDCTKKYYPDFDDGLPAPRSEEP